MLTIASTSGAPPRTAVTCPDTVVASCAVATAGTSPSRTSPIVRMERTNQRLSVIPFLLQLRFSGPTTGLRDRGDGLPARGRRDQQSCDIDGILPQCCGSRKGGGGSRPTP